MAHSLLLSGFSPFLTSAGARGPTLFGRSLGGDPLCVPSPAELLQQIQESL